MPRTKSDFIAHELNLPLMQARAVHKHGARVWAVLTYNYCRQLCALDGPYGNDGVITRAILNMAFNHLEVPSNRRSEVKDVLVRAGFWKPIGNGQFRDVLYGIVHTNRAQQRQENARAKGRERQRRLRAKRHAEAAAFHGHAGAAELSDD